MNQIFVQTANAYLPIRAPLTPTLRILTAKKSTEEEKSENSSIDTKSMRKVGKLNFYL